MSDLNIVAICGRLTRKPEVKYSANNVAYCRISVANNVWTGKDSGDKVNFFNITVFGKRAETIGEYLDKGSQVIINGRLDHNTWEDQNGNKRHSVGIIAQSVQFVGGKKKDSKPSEASSGPPPEESAGSESVDMGENTAFESPIDDTEDIPF
jgi:single-strand DNA-binding protein